MTASNQNSNLVQITRDAILRVGNVISVSGRIVKVRVDKAKNVSHLLFNGEIVKNISVGGYIKIRKGFEIIVGKIEGEYINENPFENDRQYVDVREKVDRVLEIKLVGFYESRVFKKGIKELPLIDNECFLLDREEYGDVHNFVKGGDIPLEIGTLANDKAISISVGVNSLFASHIGIFGATGSGKSYTLAGLYSNLINKFSNSDAFKENARFFLLDFNGEYVSRRTDVEDRIIVPATFKKTYNLSTRIDGERFPMSLDAINDEVLWIIAAEATEKTQVPFLRRALKNGYIERNIEDGDSFKRLITSTLLTLAKTKNKDFLSIIHSFLKDLETVVADNAEGITEAKDAVTDALKYHNVNSEFYLGDIRTGSANHDNFSQALEALYADLHIYPERMNIFTKIHIKVIFSYYQELAKGYSNREHIGPMMKRLEKRVDDLSKVLCLEDDEDSENKILTVVSLKDVNIHMRKVLPLLICKQLYEEMKIQGDRSKYLNVIIDEAHNILSDESLRESEQWKDYRLETFEEIIKEGRKFRTFLTIASQRPYDISATIVSQLHNYFLHRLVNDKDLKAIENTISFLDKVSFESLPILPTGSCILSGLVSQIPVIIEIDKIADGSEPASETYKPTDYWS